jgi:predicted PurR-regulated permease PerM
MDRGVFFALVNFTALALVVALMVTLLSPFLPSLVWGAVLAFAAFPVHRRIRAWSKGRKNLSAFLSTALVVLLAAGPMAFAATALARQSASLMGRIQDAAQAGKIPDKDHILLNPRVADALKRVEPYMGRVDPKPALEAGMKALSGAALALSTRVFKNAVGFLFQFFIMIIVVFYAFRDGEEANRNFWSVVPLKRDDKDKLKDLLHRVVEAVLYGVVLACLVQGILGGIGFAIAGLPSPVFFGAVMAFCAFIPVVGTALVWVPTAIYLAVSGRYGMALFMAIWGGLVVAGVDNIIRPLFISGRSHISLFVVALGVIGGLLTFGFLGVIVGPLLFATALELFRIYREGVFPEQRGPGRESRTGNLT